MAIRLYIFFICYITIFDALLPKVFGDVGLSWLLFFLFMAVFLMTRLFKEGLVLFNPWIFALLLFTIVNIASVSWTPYHTYDLHLVKRLFAQAFVPFFIALGAVNLFREAKNVALFIKHLSIAVFVLCVIAFAQVAFGAFGGAILKNEEMRASATFGNPNSLAAFFVIAIPVLLYGIENKILSKKRGGLALLSTIVGVFATASRKGILGIAIATTIYFLLKRNFKYFIVLSSIYAVLGVGVVFYDNVAKRFEQQDLAGRLGAASLSLSMFADSPILGLGYNGYIDNEEKYIGRHIERKRDAHNLFATVLANYGLAGFLPLMMVLIYPLGVARKVLSHRDTYTEQQRNTAIVCIAIVPAFCQMAWFSGGIVSNWPILNLFYACVSLVICADMNSKSAKRPVQPIAELMQESRLHSR